MVQGDRVELKRKRSVVARTADALICDQPPLGDEKLREAAKIAIAEGVMQRIEGKMARRFLNTNILVRRTMPAVARSTATI